MYLIFVPFFGMQPLKSLESPSDSIFLNANDLMDEWQLLSSFRIKAGHREEKAGLGAGAFTLVPVRGDPNISPKIDKTPPFWIWCYFKYLLLLGLGFLKVHTL